MILKISKINLFLGLIFFSTLFYIKYILIKPAYIALIALIVISYASKRYILKYDYFILSILFIAFLTLQVVVLNADIGMFFNAILTILIFPILIFILYNHGKKGLNFFLWISVFFLSIEALYRISNPIYYYTEQIYSEADWFYPYKFNSIMFMDSNFVALHIFCLLIISLNFGNRKINTMLFILMLLTFSRSGILGAILAFMYHFVDHSLYSKIIKPLFFSAIVILFIYLLINLNFIVDGSFQSKFYILSEVLNYADINFGFKEYVWGVGLGNTYDLIGIGAHNIFVTLFFETGFLGFIIYFIYLCYFIRCAHDRKTRKNLLSFFVIFLIMGFSLGLYLFPIMSLTIACLLILSKRNDDSK